MLEEYHIQEFQMALDDIKSTSVLGELKRRNILSSHALHSTLPDDEWYIEFQNFLENYIDDGITPEAKMLKELLYRPIIEDCSKLYRAIEYGETVIKKILSFKYIYSKELFRLNDLKTMLTDNGLLDPKASFSDFQRAFTGKAIVRKMKWLGNPTELSFIIDYLLNGIKVIKCPYQQHWNITITIFYCETPLLINTLKTVRLQSEQRRKQLSKILDILNPKN